MIDTPGPIIAIGGHEDKTGERLILKEVAKRLGEGRLVIATVASHEPEGYFDSYKAAFAALDVTNLVELYVNERGKRGRKKPGTSFRAQPEFSSQVAINCAFRARSATRPWKRWSGKFTAGVV
jgi:cyanophycinase-like exopeptidase